MSHARPVQQREPFHVRVTYELKDERAARDWYREVKRQLDNATAPIQFRVEEFFAVGREALLRGTGLGTHADVVTHETSERSWGDKPSFLLSYLGSGNPTSNDSEEEYDAIKTACLQRGVFSQCVNVAKSVGSRQENPIKVSVDSKRPHTKQTTTTNKTQTKRNKTKWKM